MNLNYFISRRYLNSKGNEKFVSIITAYSVLGIAVGVAALLIVISVMTGFERDLQKKILGLNGDIIVSQYFGYGLANYRKTGDELHKIKGIKAVAPFIYAQSMVQSASNISGVIVRGVDYENFNKVSNVLRSIRTKGYQRTNGIILGAELAKKLIVNVGDSIFIITNIQPSGIGFEPVSKKLRVNGIFKSGMFQYDAGIVFVSLSEAQRLFNLKNLITGFEIRTYDPFKSDVTAKKIKKILPYPYQVRTWKVINHNLFSAMQLERITMFIILLLIIIVAGFNIVSTIVMTVLEKKKEIALLRSIGLTQKDIKSIFLYEGISIGIIGTILGNIIGLFLIFLLKKYNFITLPADVYYISRIPAYINPLTVVIISLSAIFISFVSSVYPAIKASKMMPAEGLRNE